jgi:hypothetical protein
MDINKVSQAGAQSAPKLNLSTNQVTAHQDLSDAMRLALAEEQRVLNVERTNRNAAEAELARTRQTVIEREQQITNVQSQLQSAELQAARLHEQETNLMGQVAAAQASIAALTEQLNASKTEAALTKEQRDALEAESRKQSERAGLLERQLAGLVESNQMILADRAALSTKLQVTEAQRLSAVEKMSQLQGEVEAQQKVNTQLAESVKTLATQSTALTQEIRENRVLTPNEIFEQLTTNRLMASFYGLKHGLFGMDSSKYKQSQILLATDGTNTFAVCHVQDTLLTLWKPGTQWEDLSGTLVHNATVFSIDSISFCAQDPRIVFVPVPPAQARALGCMAYRLSQDPFKFQDAVVAGTQDNYYGECRFQMDLDNPGYLKMDRNSLKGLFGKFNPSSGDLVLSKTGELLGLMANNNYCLVLRSFGPVVQLKFGWTGDSPQTAQTLADLYGIISQMPFKLQ